MKKLALISILAASFAIAACGGKAKKQTTPENKGGTTTDTSGAKGDGTSTGGQTYGGAMKPTTPPAGGADPCAGQ